MRNVITRSEKTYKKTLYLCIVLILLFFTSFFCFYFLFSKFLFQSNNSKSISYNNETTKASISNYSLGLAKSAVSIDQKAFNTVSKNIKLSCSANAINQLSNDGIKAENAFVNDGKKTVFLTFDDGPSTTVTPQILDTLKAYNVHGTFFLVGQNIQLNNNSVTLVHRIYNEGNAIGDHTYSHDLRALYPHNKLDVNVFMNEVDKTQNLLKGILGQAFFTRVIRMPGGYMSRVYYKDPCLTAFNNILRKRNMVSIDWNSYGFDAEGKWKNSNEIFSYIKSTIGTKNKVVILMHDTYGKEETAKALPRVIEYLKSQGYEFKTLK